MQYAIKMSRAVPKYCDTGTALECGKEAAHMCVEDGLPRARIDANDPRLTSDTATKYRKGEPMIRDSQTS